MKGIDLVHMRLGPLSLVPLVRGTLPAYTDMVSNAMSLDDRLVRQALNKAPSPGALTISEPEHIRMLLHEATHHATFAGRTGGTLSALAISAAARGSMGRAPKRDWEIWSTARDDLVLRAFRRLIEPLLEGTALFAEHDARWGKYEFASHALIHYSALCLVHEIRGELSRAVNIGPPAGAFDVATQTAVNSRLLQARTSDAWVANKEHLLQQPLFGQPDKAPYLLGYLSMKRSYLALRKSSPLLDDADRFLMMNIEYWFNDPVTQEALLNLNDNNLMAIQETVTVITERFQDQWSELYQRPMMALKQLHARMLKPQQTLSPGDPLFLEIAMRTAADTMNIFVPKFHKHRLVLRLSVLRILIDSGDSTARVFDAADGDRDLVNPLLTCPVVPNAKGGRFPGTLELLRSYDGRLSALAVIGPDGLVAVRELFGETWCMPELIKAFEDIPSVDHVDAASKSYKYRFCADMWTGGDAGEVQRTILENIEECRDNTLLQIIFPGTRRDVRGRRADVLRHQGLRGVFPDLYELAELSLRFGGDGMEIDTVAKAKGIANARIRRRLEELNRIADDHLGVAVFEIEGDRAISAV